MKHIPVCLLFLCGFLSAKSQSLQKISYSENGQPNSVLVDGQEHSIHNRPLFSVDINGKNCTQQSLPAFLKATVEGDTKSSPGLKTVVRLMNQSNDTIVVSNFVPFGASADHMYITGLGDHPLSRTHLFIPGRIPVNVVCPDNAWELGYSAIPILDSIHIAALSRRIRESLDKGQRRRFETVLFPGGSIGYAIYADVYAGEWQRGLKLMFQDRYLYDVSNFNNSMFGRKDLSWIRHSYIIHLVMAWNRVFYDADQKSFNLESFEGKAKKLYGGNDVLGIWPTWPSLGLDQRNQFDLFRDLPGGTARLKSIAGNLRKNGTRFFVCYNPWDESTRAEGHLAGIGDLIKETSADGVVLDTRGASSHELQEAADKVKPGVVMYSEGMAVVKDMPGIVAGRVHNALYYVPMLNLNKFIKPDFAIFRVAELFKEPIQREYATSFFNGYGTELNIFAPGIPDWAEEQYKYLGRTTRILRDLHENFTSFQYTPLAPVTRDSIWANKWVYGKRHVYTIYSVLPEGYSGYLLEADTAAGFHYVDLWHHRMLTPAWVNGKWMLPAETDAFASKWLGTNNEGEVDCIVRFPELLKTGLNGDLLTIEAPIGDAIEIFAGRPAYDKKPVRLKSGRHELSVSKLFNRFEGDICIRLMEGENLIDERIETIIPGTPRRISKEERTPVDGRNSAGMVRIPAGRFVFHESHGDEFIPYPMQDTGKTFEMPSLLMDKYPVTNREFREFLTKTGYKPADAANFLKHWTGGRIPAGQEDFPVVYISYEDARAYARWADKRLPTEREWQYAAQTDKCNEWPWQQEKPVIRKEEVVNESLTVTSLEGIDSSVANLGNGKPYAVGAYPKGVNPFGLYDLAGLVWQLTNDVYMNGSYKYIIMKGGSYFKPSSSWWYVQGGPRELHYRQYLLRVSPGFERNATVGFRCVRDL